MNKIIYRLDWVTILLYVALVIFGISNIYSTNYNENSNLINLKTPVGKQVAFAVASFIVAIVMLTIKAKVFERFASVFYLLTLILLIGLLLLAVIFLAQPLGILLVESVFNLQNLQKLLLP